MASFAEFLHWLGLLLYGGPLLAFALLVGLAGRLGTPEPWRVVRAWRAWGPGSGLGLAALILGGLLRFYQVQGGFSWGVETGWEQLMLAKHLVFLVLWVDYTITEVWVAEPLRRLDGPAGFTDQGAARVARRRLAGHLAFSAALLLLILVLGCLLP